ncbi:hypothetical protein AVEN_238325-1 [Araneus ventricosus]|uniref:Uncharacterized protein n=1 Tax=Araneus ventricosus TaxID=182803 RepID=A0A4Y2F1P4_ARAVE|nr:hypothetical protein AVEN_238325-1 [Araneus ventricosus]
MAVSSAKKQFMIWLVLGEIRGVECIEKWTKDASLWNSGFYASNIGERMIELGPEGPVSKVFYKDDYEVVWNFELDKLVDQTITPHSVKYFADISKQ